MSAGLKGGTFTNRYVFKAQLKASSPLHIGSGIMIERVGLVDEKNKPLQISGIVVDGGNKPYIPGSSLRGAMRDWLREVWGEADRENDELNKAISPLIDAAKKNNANSAEIAGIIAANKKRMELLFGSAFAEGKLEVWEARCVSNVDTPTNNLLSRWGKDRLTYVAKSVAINPETGTAEDKKLYNFELVPEGTCFNITLTAQNLSDDEVALILHALDGFEHPTLPLAIGAMTKRGFGRFSLDSLDVYRLVKNDIKTWKELCARDNLAGYESICREEFKIKNDEIAKLKELVKCSALASPPLKTEWIFNLETPLVVRSGSKFGWKNAAASKTRNYEMQFKWGEQTLDEISDLYFSLKINGINVEPYYHIPSSSIRGTLREWTIKHLLPVDWWDIEKSLKQYAKIQKSDRPKLPKHLKNICCLFGFVVSTGDKSLDKEFTRVGRLTIDVLPFQENQTKPDVDGLGENIGNIYGPANAKRHIKTRNPLDRITNAAKEGGLHSLLEFSKGQSFKVTLTIGNPEDFDKQLIGWWCNEINAGIIRFGGLCSIGRGRVTAQEVNDVKNKGQTITSLADLGKIVDKAKLKPNNIKQHSPMQNQEWYDKKLNTEPQATHNPNPFDFVFFSEDPKTYKLEDFNNFGTLQSGYLEVQLKVLTPVHIVGKQTPESNRVGQKILMSHFYQQDGQPCIPGSSIRGMLRSFIEAVTNGWVSQVKDLKYCRQEGGNNIRHIEFSSWNKEPHNHKCLNSPTGVDHEAPPAIPVAFKPVLSGDEMDIATYLFGYVDGSKEKEAPPARAGKVIIEDVYLNNSLLKNDCKMVDVEGSAIMGGPRPRANWWYMRPKEVWDRSVRGGALRVAHIVGDEFWGRKFYYHQDPEKCIKWYLTENNWHLGEGITLYEYDLKCLDKEKTVSFRIYLNRVPEKLVQLICTCLCLPGNMRYKLGYGKAFGYGSVEFSISSAILRDEKTEDWPELLRSKKPDTLTKSWNDEMIKPFIDEPSLNKLVRILTWNEDDNSNIIFTYPPFNRQNFQKVIQKRDFCTSTLPLSNPKNIVDEAKAIEVANELWNKKKPIHFPLYQARAKGYDKIKHRKP